MKSEKLSVLIITKNEEQNLKKLISTLDFSDEIVVVDSNSTDNTPAIAEKLGAKTYTRKFDNHAAQKNWGLDKISSKWVLIIDADERVSDGLKEEVLATINMAKPTVAYWIKRSNIFMGKKIKYSGWQRDKVIRLINKDFCKYNTAKIHEEISTTGKVGMLKHKLIHHTYKDLPTYLSKITDYTNKKAIMRYNKGKRTSYFSLLFKPFFKFISRYFFKLGILDGKQGLIVSMLTAYNVFLTNLKIERLAKGESLDKSNF